MRLPFVFLVIALYGCSAAAATPYSVDPIAVHTRRFDVIVYGGTPGGIAAALSAARRGMTVGLITRDRKLGGDLTDGALDQWDINQAPGGDVVQAGIYDQIHNALPDGFSPVRAARYFQDLIGAQPRITRLVLAATPQIEFFASDAPRRIRSLDYLSSQSLLRVQAAEFIDASDNGDLAIATKARYDLGRQDEGHDNRMQPATLIFSLGGVDWSRVVDTYSMHEYGYGGAGGDQAYGYGAILKAYRSLSTQALVPDANFQLQADGGVMVNAIDILGVDGRSAASLSHARKVAEAESRHLTEFLREHIPGFEHAYVRSFAHRMYVRETRHVLGLFTVTPDYIWQQTVPYDTIGLAAFPLDVHPVQRGDVGGAGWAEESRVYGLPLRALVVKGFKNLAIVGPAVSATHVAAGSLRVIPTTIVEGEGVGAACSLAIARGVSLETLATSPALIGSLRQRLASAGADVGTVREVASTPHASGEHANRGVGAFSRAGKVAAKRAHRHDTAAAGANGVVSSR